MNDASSGAKRGPAEIRDYGRLLATYWIIVAACLALGLGTALAWTQVQRPLYATQASGYIVVTPGPDVASLQSAESVAQSKTAGYLFIAESLPVAERVRTELGLSVPAAQLLEQISVDNPTGTTILRITAEAAEAEDAVTLADAWLAALARQIRQIEGHSSGADELIRLDPLGTASLPLRPVFPNPVLALGLGGLGGLVVGLAIAVVRSASDRRVRSAETVEAMFQLPVLGVLPRERNRRHVRGRTGVELPWPRSEAMQDALRSLWTGVRFTDAGRPLRSIVITSPMPRSGRSFLTAQLAVTIAASGQPVIVVDAQLHARSISDIFGVQEGPGFGELLAGACRPEDVLQTWARRSNLQVIAAGSSMGEPDELLGTPAAGVLLAQLAQRAIVLVDAPPLRSAPEVAVLTKMADGALVVVREDTQDDELGDAVRSLARAGASILGVVMNRLPSRSARERRDHRERAAHAAHNGVPSSPLVTGTAASNPAEIHSPAVALER